jgi:predicted AAA+ superfamily ATPase
LQESPQRGNSWEGYLVEQMITLERLTHVGSQFYFYRTHAGMEVDLLVDRGRERVGFEFKCAMSVDRKDWANLKGAIEDGIIHSGSVIYLGDRSYAVADKIEVVSAESLLRSN